MAMEIFEFLKRLHDECLNYSQDIKFEKKHPRHRNLVCLYGTLLEFTACLVMLIEKKLRTGVPSIFRSFLEAYIELHNLHEKAEYGYHMEALNLDQWIRVLKGARDYPNPYLEKIAELENLDEIIEKHEKQLKKLKDEGFLPLTVKGRFERAGMLGEYYSLYNFLSSQAHSTIRALIDRHIEIRNDDFSVVFYKDEPIESFSTYLDSTASLLIDASDRIHKFFETGCSEKIEKLRNELAEIRSKY